MNILKTYYNSGNLPMAEQYLKINNIRALTVCRASVPADKRKVWRIFELTGFSCGCEVGEYRTKADAIADALTLGNWLNLPCAEAVK